MKFVEVIREGIEDIVSIQIATLHGGDVPLDSAIDEATKKKIEALIEKQVGRVLEAQNAWLDAESGSERRKLKRVLRSEKRTLAELRLELYAVAPRDIFSKVEIAMGKAATAAYSKYHISAESVNFLNSSLGEDKAHILEAHNNHVKTAIDARQSLLNMAKELVELGMSL